MSLKLLNKEEALINLHIAEYQMLTNRCTYWIYIKYGLWALYGLFLTIIWNNTTVSHLVLIWYSIITGQIIILLLGTLVNENYNAILYLERKLYRSVLLLVNNPNFWKYESYLKKHRKFFFRTIQTLCFQLFPAWQFFLFGTS